MADLLGIEFDDLRERAHGAMGQLVGWEPTDASGELLIDNGLGQLPVAVRRSPVRPARPALARPAD